MKFKAWFKDKTADRVLAPVRNCIANIIEPNSNVLEIGSGTGHLLFLLQKKINSGVGIDIDQNMINFANDKRQNLNINNLQFFNSKIESIKDYSDLNFDVCTSTLCIHEMEYESAIATLNQMAHNARRSIIADFSVPNTFTGKMGIEIDELISGHYSQYCTYKKNGYLPYLASLTEFSIVSTQETSVDGIKIWELKSNIFT